MRLNGKNFGKHLSASDVRGIAQLLVQATVGVTGMVEGVHQSVLNTIGGAGGEAQGANRHITGLVYKIVRAVTKLVGKCTDSGLAGLQPLFDDSIEDNKSGTSQRQAVLATLNGVMGDRLAANKNAFAIPMSMRYAGEPLHWQALPAMPGIRRKILLLIHGLCLNDLHWRRLHLGKEVCHGDALASALEYTPVYLRYNSGLHTSQNGRELSTQLEQLISHWPTAIEEISMLAHSMGGLVARSACHYGELDGMVWPGFLKKMVFLGTPHQGALLERVGHWIDIILTSTPYTAPFAAIGKLRSAGITDLRYGNVLDQDWQGRDRFSHSTNSYQAVPLPMGVACFTAAAISATKQNTFAQRLIGDGLVTLQSALGQHDDPQRNLGFAKSSQWIGYGMNHLGLLSRPEVTQQLIKWLEPGSVGMAK